MDSDRRLFIFIVALDTSFNAKEVNLKDAGDGENRTAFDDMVRTRLRAFGTNKLENM